MKIERNLDGCFNVHLSQSVPNRNYTGKEGRVYWTGYELRNTYYSFLFPETFTLIVAGKIKHVKENSYAINHDITVLSTLKVRGSFNNYAS